MTFQAPGARPGPQGAGEGREPLATFLVGSRLVPSLSLSPSLIRFHYAA